ncbi:MAG: LamG domain-containing protein [Planctomycetota bacterium]|jgi:hypothetical protein
MVSEGILGGVSVVLCVICVFPGTANDRPVAWWKFDEGGGETAADSAGGMKDSIEGNFRRVEGVSGSAVKLDGFTTRIVRKAGDAPRPAKAFTVEAWVAPQAYPRNWCAVVNQESNRKAGYFLGIDEFGHVGLHLAVDGKWQKCTSEAAVPFMEKWSHVAGTFEEDNAVTVFIDGNVAASIPVQGKLTLAEGTDLQIGRNQTETRMNPQLLVRRRVNFPVSYSFDGIIDELKIYDRSMSAEEIKQAYGRGKPKGAPPLKWRKLPQLPAGSDRFGAVYCRLKFYPEWDALWPVHEHPDIVVSFDGGPHKMVFWRGTNYNMNLVTENGKWVGDQSAEKGGGGTIGCCEHMSDKQCRYAHVRIIENHDARVVVHWRYALCDVLYKIARQDRLSGWGAWADEYYYIYPDGVAVRYFQVHGVNGCSITEPAALNNPGEKAENNLHLDAITTANMKGEMRSHSWDPWPSSGRTGAPFTSALPNANISVVNFKSVSKPYYIYEPGTSIIPYGGGTKELRTEYSKFPTWNHWPTSLDPSDGHYPVAADRVTSSAVTSPEPPMKQRGDGSVEGRFIMGLTDKPIDQLAPLARSWLLPPELKVISKGFSSEGYSRDQRAYLLTRQTQEQASLDFELVADEQSPVLNPAFVIRNWGEVGVVLRIDGEHVERGKDFRFGQNRTLHGTDLVGWIRKEATKPVKVLLGPADH